MHAVQNSLQSSNRTLEDINERGKNLWDFSVLTSLGQLFSNHGLLCMFRCNIITSKQSEAGKEIYFYVRGQNPTLSTFGSTSLQICHLPCLFFGGVQSFTFNVSVVFGCSVLWLTTAIQPSGPIFSYMNNEESFWSGS